MSNHDELIPTVSGESYVQHIDPDYGCACDCEECTVGFDEEVKCICPDCDPVKCGLHEVSS